MIGFGWPWAFLLAPIAWVAWRFLPPAAREEPSLRIPALDHLRSVSSRASIESGRGNVRKVAMLLAWAGLILAAAQPRWIGDPVSLPSSGRDLMLAVDISESMKMPDMVWDGENVDRLIATRMVVGEFVENRLGDRLGLILFGTRAYVHVPLSFDRETVRKLLDEAQIGMAGESTAIGDAIGLAVKRLRERPADSRVLILLTDGANTAGEIPPVQAAQLAADAGIRIYTVGIGADELVVSGFFSRRQINPSRDLDEETLQEIASITGGGYFRARDSEELREIYQLLDELEPVEQDVRTFRPVKALYYWPLGAALLISLAVALSIVLRETAPSLASGLPGRRAGSRGNG